MLPIWEIFSGMFSAVDPSLASVFDSLESEYFCEAVLVSIDTLSIWNVHFSRFDTVDVKTPVIFLQEPQTTGFRPLNLCIRARLLFGLASGLKASLPRIFSGRREKVYRASAQWLDL